MPCRAFCSVKGCRNQKSKDGLSFFKLPMDEERRNRWLEIIDRPDLQQKSDLKPDCYVICSTHFEQSMLYYKPMLRPHAIPTKNVPTLPNPVEEERFQNKMTQTVVSHIKLYSNNDSDLIVDNGNEMNSRKSLKRKLCIDTEIVKKRRKSV